MKLERYDVAIIISEPGLDLEDRDATNTISAVLRDVPRDSVIDKRLPLRGLLEQFEEMFQ